MGILDDSGGAGVSHNQNMKQQANMNRPLSPSLMEETGGHGGDLQAAAAAFARKEGDFYDFSSNINPMGPPAGLVDELRGHLERDLLSYPVPQARTFRRALAQAFSIPEGRLLVGNGASELIHLFFLWLRPRRTVIPAPTFSEYERGALLAGSEVERIPLYPDAPIQPEAFYSSVGKGDCLVFCNPNNPTGTCYPRQTLEPIIEGALSRGAAVLLDESFFLLTGRPLKEGFFCSDRPDLWTVVSLTKLWALPGIRLGFLVGPENKIGPISRLGDPWRVNALAQRAGLYCVQDKAYVHASIQMINDERAFMVDKLAAFRDLTVFPSWANYLLVRGDTRGFSSTDLHLRLAARGVLIRDAANFPGLDQRFFRIAVRGRKENLILLEALNAEIGETNL